MNNLENQFGTVVVVAAVIFVAVRVSLFRATVALLSVINLRTIISTCIYFEVTISYQALPLAVSNIKDFKERERFARRKSFARECGRVYSLVYSQVSY